MLAAQGTDGVYTTMTQFLAAAATAYVVAAVLRVYSDEESGLGEAVLAGAVSRWRWLLTAVAAALLGSTVLMFFAGLGNGLGAGITLGEPQTVWRLTLAGLAFVPAMAVLAGIAALAVALRHPWIGWLAVTFVVTSLYLGALLRLPQWLLDVSPVGRTTAPTEYSGRRADGHGRRRGGADPGRRLRSIAAATRSEEIEGRIDEDRSSMLASAIFGLVFFGVLLFWPAGTFDYWQAWVFIAVFIIATMVPSIYLAVQVPGCASAALCIPGRSQRPERCRSSSPSASF